MPSEELHQRGLLRDGKLKGVSFGNFEDINIGQTKLSALVSAGLDVVLPASVNFPFKKYAPPKKAKDAKPDRLFCIRTKNKLSVVAVAEHKAPSKFKGKDRLHLTAEQGIYSAAALGARIAIATDGTSEKYVDVTSSLRDGEVVFFDEKRSLNPAVLEDLLAGHVQERDPGELSERVWQHIWHATKDEPKNCLLTFVELFVLKFLSDNLSTKYLPEAYRFYELLGDPKSFNDKHGKSQIEYYIEVIRPQIKKVFQDNIHDDVMVIEVLRDDINHEFLVCELQDAISEGNFEYEAKLYNRVKELSVEIPSGKTKGSFDLQAQNKIAGAVKRFNTVRSKLFEAGKWSSEARFKG